MPYIYDPSSKVVEVQEHFHNFNDDIQWTIPSCSICNIPEVTCPHYWHLDFLDTRITLHQVEKDDIMLLQFSMSAYSKPTDVHAYLSPLSCTAPHLNEEGISVAKTVGVRLRSIHSNDQDLFQSLNLYSGYLIARGYQEKSSSTSCYWISGHWVQMPGLQGLHLWPVCNISLLARLMSFNILFHHLFIWTCIGLSPGMQIRQT